MIDFNAYEAYTDHNDGEDPLAVVIDISNGPCAIVWLDKSNAVSIFNSLGKLQDFFGVELIQIGYNSTEKNNLVLIFPEPAIFYLVYNGEGFGIVPRESKWDKTMLIYIKNGEAHLAEIEVNK